MEDDSYSADDDSLNIASKCWKRVVNAATKTGYREGVQDGTDSVLQKGFDIGFKDGFETAFVLGKYKGLNAALSQSSIKQPANIAAALDKTKRGACWICSMESQNKISAYKDTSFPEILNHQRVHSTEVINRLHEHFQPILKKSGIETSLNF